MYDQFRNTKKKLIQKHNNSVASAFEEFLKVKIEKLLSCGIQDENLDDHDHEVIIDEQSKTSESAESKSSTNSN